MRHAEVYSNSRLPGIRGRVPILEVVMSVGGMIVPSKAYVQAVRKWCDENGALMIVDESQSGVGPYRAMVRHRALRCRAGHHHDVEEPRRRRPAVRRDDDARDRRPCRRAGFHQSSSHTDDPFLCAVGLANIEIVEREAVTPWKLLRR
jgi:2,2-dialkylglycine decarboxylase (pyruvate)